MALMRILAIFLVTFFLSACSMLDPRPAPAQNTTSVMHPAPAGLNIDPSDATKGWITAGGQTVHFKLTSSGWLPDTTAGAPPTSLVTSTPTRYEPMMRFLRENGLSVQDIEIVAQAYNAMAIREAQSANAAIFLRRLNETLSGTSVPLDQAVNTADILRQVNTRVQ